MIEAADVVMARAADVERRAGEWLPTMFEAADVVMARAADFDDRRV